MVGEGESASDQNVTFNSEGTIKLQSGFKFSSDGQGTFKASNDDCPDDNAINTIGQNQHGFVDKANTDYTYDDNGNLTANSDKDIQMSYNYLNLPYEAIKGQNKTEWLYSAEGEKLITTNTIQSSIDETKYLNNIEIKGSDFVVYHSEGQVRVENGIQNWEYNIKDHLGNVRLVYSDKDQNNQIEVLQNNNYYPFGMRMHGEWSYAGEEKNRYLYNGKELDNDLGLDMYDYGARFYDPVIGRFTSIDRYTTEFPEFSPYHYANNNPIQFIDINGDSTIWPAVKQIPEAMVSFLGEKTGADKFAAKVSEIFNQFEEYLSDIGGSRDPNEGEGDQLENQGADVVVYGKGSKNGWSIQADKPNPEGDNAVVDLAGIPFEGRSNGSKFLKSYGFNRLENTKKTVEKTRKAKKGIDQLVDNFGKSGKTPKADSIISVEVRSDGQTVTRLVPRKK